MNLDLNLEMVCFELIVISQFLKLVVKAKLFAVNITEFDRNGIESWSNL